MPRAPSLKSFRIAGLSVLSSAVASLAACAPIAVIAPPRPLVKVPPPPPPATIAVDGVYDWSIQATDEQGDLRLEKEEWHLSQTGRAIKGYYDRTVTVVSTDEQPYRCNRKLSFVKSTRVLVSGSVAGDTLEVREVAFETPTRPNPCDDGHRMLVRYRGIVRDATIKLMWAPDAGQTLYRREAHAGAAAEPASARSRSVESGSALEPLGTGGTEASMPVAGTYEWELRSVDADGDQRIEHEEWQLDESPEGIVGHYDRTVTRVRGEGLFACNRKDRYRTTTRYTVHGQRIADRFKIVEVEYTSDPDPCDNGRRRMDSYDGAVAAAGDELVLNWGSGSQLLRRKK